MTKTDVTPRTLAQLTVRKREYLVPRYLQKGRLTLLAGPPGEGKSKIAMQLAAAVSTGSRFAGVPCECSNILLYSKEDDLLEDTLPCLHNEQADVRRIFDPGENFDLGENMAILQEMVQHYSIGLVILDPAIDVGTGSSAVNPNNAIQVRTALKPLQALCEQTRCAVLGLVHFRKADGSGLDGATALDRIAGSGAWAQLARAVIVVGRSKQRPDRIMCLAKSQQAEINGGLSYTIRTDPNHPYPDTATVHFDLSNPLNGSAEEILGSGPDGTSAVQLALDDIRDYLGEQQGWCKRDKIVQAVLENNSKSAVGRAFTRIREDDDSDIVVGARDKRGWYCKASYVHKTVDNS